MIVPAVLNPLRSAFQRWLGAAAAATGALAVVVFAITSWVDYRDTRERAWAEADATAQVLEEQILRTVENGRLIGMHVADVVRRDGIESLRMNGHAILQQAATKAPLISSVWIMDRQGDVIANSIAAKIGRAHV